MGAEDGGEAAHAEGASRRGERPADERARARGNDRSGHRLPARHQSEHRGPDALRRLRPAPGGDALHPDQAVPRGAGGASGDGRTPRSDLQHLREACRRRSHSHHHLHPVHAAADAALRQPPGAVPGGDALLQPRAGRRPGSASQAIRRAEAQIGLPGSIRRTSGHRADFLRSLRTSPCSCSRRWSPSTSSSACCTRLRAPGDLPISRRFPRRASGRSSRSSSARLSSASSRSSGSSFSSAS